MSSHLKTEASYGYHGRYLRVDVSTGQAEAVPLAPKVLRQFLGGSGLGTWLLLHSRAASVDPLSEEAPLAFVFSPLVGSPLTTSAKFAVVSKSPLTQRINDSLASSGFAIAGKKTGHDAIVITGRAERLSVLIIDEESARLEAADDLAGSTCGQTEAMLRQRFGAGLQFCRDWASRRAASPIRDNLARRAARWPRRKRGGARGEEY